LDLVILIVILIFIVILIAVVGFILQLLLLNAYLKLFTFTVLQGGFAYCYELTDTDTMEVYAGKVVSKTLLVKQHQKDKVQCYNVPVTQY